jgi:S-phase kinase-associated protein 1
MDTVTLVANDAQAFEVPRAVADTFGTIAGALADCGGEGDDAGARVPLPMVTGAVLARALKYATFHADAPPDAAAVAAFDKAFVDAMDKEELHDVILAANYLNHAALLDVACQAVADMICGKTPEEIRAAFGIRNDFTPDEEAEIRAQNQWAFD